MVKHRKSSKSKGLTKQQRKFKGCAGEAAKKATAAVRKSASANFFKTYGSGMKTCMRRK